MGYGIQTATNEQTSLFVEEQTTKPKQASVPIYRVTLVKEGRVPCYNQQIRSAVDAATLLHRACRRTPLRVMGYLLASLLASL